MKKFLGFIHLIWILCWAVLATLVLFLPCMVVTLLSNTGNQAFRLTQVWARIVLAASFVRVRIRNRERIKKGISYIIISNHQSFYDIPAIVTTLGIQFRWVITKGVLKVPLFGYALYASRNIFIDRSNPGRAMKSIRAGMKRIPPGVSVLIFPEGGRSRDGAVRPFKKGAFVMAVDKQWPILPVTVNGSRAVHAKGQRGIIPGAVEVVVGEPIDPRPYGDEALDALVERARMAVISNHKPDQA